MSRRGRTLTIAPAPTRIPSSGARRTSQTPNSASYNPLTEPLLLPYHSGVLMIVVLFPVQSMLHGMTFATGKEAEGALPCSSFNKSSPSSWAPPQSASCCGFSPTPFASPTAVTGATLTVPSKVRPHGRPGHSARRLPVVQPGFRAAQKESLLAHNRNSARHSARVHAFPTSQADNTRRFPGGRAISNMRMPHPKRVLRV
jgi:hypothetical protein